MVSNFANGGYIWLYNEVRLVECDEGSTSDSEKSVLSK
jgi:hypothetical protein